MNIFHYCFSIIFFCIISIPLGLTLCNKGPTPIPLIENRLLAQKPKLQEISFRKWPRHLDDWFRDRLAFRNHFVGLYFLLWENFFESTTPYYFRGKYGEWFLSGYMGLYFGTKPFSLEHLIHLKLSHAGMHAFLKSKGIPYILVTIPDKATLYPEFMPFWVPWSKGTGYYDHISARVKEANIQWVDLLPTLQEKKSIYKRKLYNKIYDPVHWSGHGMAEAYQKLGHVLAEFDSGFIPKPEGIFYEMCTVEHTINHYLKDDVPTIRHLQSNTLQLQPIAGKQNDRWWEPQYIVNTKPLTAATIWFAGDSYFLGVEDIGKNRSMWPVWSGPTPLLAYYSKSMLKLPFAEFTLDYLKQHLDTDYAPTIVIESFVERNPYTSQRAETDPELRIFGDIHLNTPGHILSSQNAKQLFQHERFDCIYIYEENRVGIQTLSKHAWIQLPSVTTDFDGRAVFITHIHAPEKTVAVVGYAPAGTKEAEDRHFQYVELQPGKNLVHLFFLTEPNQKVDMFFYPGMHIGEYYILPMPEDIQCVQNLYSDRLLIRDS